MKNLLTGNRFLLPLFIWAFAALLIVTGCNQTSVNDMEGPVSGKSGSVTLAIKIGRVGLLGKRTDIELEMLFIGIRKAGTATPVLDDTIPLSGNGEITVQRTYAGLTAPGDYYFVVASFDKNGAGIHLGPPEQFSCIPGDTVDVSIDAEARVSMLRVAFIDIPDVVNKVTCQIDSGRSFDSTFDAGTEEDVVLSYDYLGATLEGTVHEISLRAGIMENGEETILYAADTSIVVTSGVDAAHQVVLKWVGQEPGEGAVTVSVNLGLSMTLINAVFDTNKGLVAYYPFNGNADDESGNGHNGTVNGAVPTEDRHGNSNSAFIFDGIDDYILIEDAEPLRITGQISMSAWFTAEDVLPFACILCKAEATEPRHGYLIDINDHNSVRADVIYDHSENIQGTVLSDTGLLDNSWHHIAAVYDGTNFRLYIDGDLHDSIIYEEGLQTNEEPLLIGWDQNTYMSHRHFEGAIDDIRIYNRALSTKEILELFNE